MALEKEKDKTSNTYFNTDISDKPQMQIKRMLNGTFNAGEKMKSTEVYKIINLIIKEDFKALGYKKTKGGMLGFYKKINNPDASVGVCCSHKVVAVGFNTLRYDASVGVLNPPHE